MARTSFSFLMPSGHEIELRAAWQEPGSRIHYRILPPRGLAGGEGAWDVLRRPDGACVSVFGVDFDEYEALRAVVDLHGPEAFAPHWDSKPWTADDIVAAAEAV